VTQEGGSLAGKDSSDSPLYIALIQTAAALPFFQLALPAGTIADIVDRRKLILVAEGWMFAR